MRRRGTRVEHRTHRFKNKGLVAATCVAGLVMTGCSSGGSKTAASNPADTASVSPTQTSSGPLTTFPPDAAACPPDTSAPPIAQLTLVHRGVLYGASPDGTGLHCLSDGGGGIDHWSADGRFYFDSKGQVDNLVAGISDFSYPVTSVRAEEFNRPTADSTYFQATMQGGIRRFNLTTGQDDSQLVSGSGAADLTVSPDGKTLAYYGFDTSDQTQKIWTVSSAGGQPTAAVSLPNAGTTNGHIYATAQNLTFVDNDKLLYLQSSTTDQGGPFLLMSLTIGQQSQQVATVGQKLDDTQAIGGLVAAEGGSHMVATDFGDCTGGIHTSVTDISSKPTAQAIPGLDQYPYVTPVGWLPDGRLAVLARTNDCHGSGDLLLWMPGSATATVFASGVTSAAVRVPGSLQVPARVS